jgi:D-3-phosphoglycerate dehydrogenase / 2-oxoglutarate reductase
MNKPIVLITNRFDQNTKLKLFMWKEVEFIYVANLLEDLDLLKKATGLIVRSTTIINEELLNKTKNLKFVITATSGFDHIDLAAAKQKNIHCYHIPETQSIAAAELTLLLILAACRKFTLAQKQIIKGDWQRSLLLGRQLSGQNLGIIGLGRVGKEVAKRAIALGMKVSAHDPFIQEHDPSIKMLGFEELMRSSDIVSLHVPKTKKTHHMIRREALSWLNADSILINMSRGDVINEDDLINHLMANPEFVAGLDVFAKEPLSTTSHLFKLHNVVLTPHVGASTKEALLESSVAALEKSIKILNGEEASGALPPQEIWFDE